MPDSRRDQTGSDERRPPAEAPERRRAERDENEIDRILDASFPASDPPPWTLGVGGDDDAKT